MRSHKIQKEPFNSKSSQARKKTTRLFPYHHEKGGVSSLLNRRLLRLWWDRSSEKPGKGPLYPLYTFSEALYGRLLAMEQKRSISMARNLPRPVISIGNLVVGGTGKTPMVLWLGKHLKEEGFNVTVLSGGYGGSRKGVSQVEISCGLKRASSLCGDEPVLLAAKGLTVWVGKDRFLAGGEALKSEPVNFFLVDDGFQHLKLQRNLDLVLLDALNPWGNGLLLPFGPLREPVKNLERADAFILTRTPPGVRKTALASFLARQFPFKPVFSCHHRLTGFRRGLHGDRVPLGALQKARVVAFSGIAKPHEFLRSLQSVDIHPSRYHTFPDHHPYQLKDIEMLCKSLDQARADFIMTTEKDYVRFPPFPQAPVVTAQVAMDFGDETKPFVEFIQERVTRMLQDPSPF